MKKEEEECDGYDPAYCGVSGIGETGADWTVHCWGRTKERTHRPPEPPIPRPSNPSEGQSRELACSSRRRTGSTTTAERDVTVDSNLCSDCHKPRRHSADPTLQLHADLFYDPFYRDPSVDPVDYDVPGTIPSISVLSGVGAWTDMSHPQAVPVIGGTGQYTATCGGAPTYCCCRGV